MVQPKAAYRNPRDSKSRNSNLSNSSPQPKPSLDPRQCRTPRPSGFPLTRGQVARSLVELCELGLVEAYEDQYGIVRYQPTQGRIA
jgi:hypothetical protein